MSDDDVTLGEVYRLLKDVRTNMVSRETNDAVVESLRDADQRNARDISGLASKFEDAEKDIRSAGRARVNGWIAAGLAVAGSIIVKLFWPTP